MTLSPLQRLRVNDGLLITADRWQIAHGYHQQRQAIHYEALHQGGIVSGLGVSVGPIPTAAPSKYRRPRWLTIQPGLAIDAKGNPIVVAAPESCYLSAQPLEETTIYIVLKHSERLPPTDAEIIQEAFQIVEKNAPAACDEVELCRVQLTPGTEGIAFPDDVFAPTVNQLDLRHRQSARLRSQLIARVAVWPQCHEAIPQFEALFEALPGLYPSLQGEIVTQPLQGDLCYLSHEQFCLLDYAEQRQLAQYLRQGGVLLVESAIGALGELFQIEAELRSAVAAGRMGAAASLQTAAEEELIEIQACIADGVAKLSVPLRAFIAAEELPLPDSGELAAAHQLRSQPFCFGRLPTLNRQPIGLYGWGGLLLLVGPLLQAWDASEWLDLSRDELRSAQELGINLLSFAARRRQLQQLLTPVASSSGSPGNNPV